MNRIKKVSRPAASLLALLLCMTLLASTAFAAGGALGADRNGAPYTYVIGYMYSGSSQTVNTREIFTSPNNYDIWLCPVCGRDPLGNSQGTALSPNLYMPCYGYDIAAAGGDMSIRYALVRRMTARQKKEIVVKVEQMAPNRSTVQCDSPMPETPFIIPEPKTEIRAKKPERRSSRQEKGQAVKQPVPKMEIPNILKELETGGCA